MDGAATGMSLRKGGGRNINNDRYLYLNVDDNPAPIPELRRLLDMNLAFLWQEKVNRLTTEGKPKEARDAALKYAGYSSTAQAYLSLGILDYGLSDKAAALVDFRKAIQLDATFKQRFAIPADGAAAGRGAQRMRAILDDKEFLKQLLGQ